MKNLTQRISPQFFGAALRVVTLSLFVMVFGAGAALAQTANDALYRVIAGPHGSRNNFTGTVGSKFTVSANVSVGKLGFEDELLNGLASSHQVGLWNSSGTLLASVTVQSGSGSVLIGNWRYETLTTPVTLIAGSTYTIGAQVTNGGDKWTDNGNSPIEFAINPTYSLGSPPNVFSNGSFAFPNLDGLLAALRWAPANLLPTTTQEQVPFTVTGTGTITSTTSLPGGLTQINFGTAGNATHLGQFTGPLTRIQDYQGNFGSTAVIVSSNGTNSVFLTVNGTFSSSQGQCAVVTSTGTYIVTGGTGAFANATGSGTINTQIDKCANTATGTYTGTISKPQPSALSEFVVFSQEQTHLRANAKVFTGNVGANISLPDPNGGADDKEEVEIGERVTMLQAGSKVIGDTVRLRSDSQVYDVNFNESFFSTNATILGNQISPRSLPVLTMPALPAITPGANDVVVPANQSLMLAPGAYRNITVNHDATLILTGGIYQMEKLDIRQDAKLHFTGATEMRVKNEMDTDASAFIGPAPSASSLTASDIKFFCEGADDGGDLAATVVQIGERNTVIGNIYAPNGTVFLRANTIGTGAFIGKRAEIGERVELTLKSAF